MAYQSHNPMFRSLDDKEEAEFRAYARKNYEPNPAKQVRHGFKPDPHIHHPIIIDECAKLDAAYQEELRNIQTQPPFGKEGK